MPRTGSPIATATRKPAQIGYSHVRVIAWLNHHWLPMAISATKIAEINIILSSFSVI